VKCATVRRRLIEHRRDSAIEGHLETCGACATFAARRAALATALGADREAHLPDPAFSARVLARRGGPIELLGLAAWRLMPAALVLALAAAWLSATAPASLVDLILDPTDDAVLMLAVGAAGGPEP
jgi:hypothetical protein